MIQLPWLGPNPSLFPEVSEALDDPEGLLAAGGDLSPTRIVNAYAQGIFPWFEEDQPILWWSPNPRTVLRPGEVHVSRSLRKLLKQQRFSITCDTCFSEVIDACAAPRGEHAGTWITDDMRAAYVSLHKLGIAHSIEVWQEDKLAGGLYGLALGRVFFGESMFSRYSNASKVAFVVLCHNLKHWGFELIDCQVHNEHLASLGAYGISRDDFVDRLQQLTGHTSESRWPTGAELEQP